MTLIIAMALLILGLGVYSSILSHRYDIMLDKLTTVNAAAKVLADTHKPLLDKHKALTSEYDKVLLAIDTTFKWIKKHHPAVMQEFEDLNKSEDQSDDRQHQ